MIGKRPSQKAILACAVLFALAAVPTRAAAQDLKDVKTSLPLLLKGQGSFFVGGSTHNIEAKYISPSIFQVDPGTSMMN